MSADLEARITAIENRLEIGQLPIRYALAVDSRDMDSWVDLFVPDVDCGKYGRGRAALRRYITPLVQTFYRSAHLICGHRVELVDELRATGKTYCRAEHEVGERWIVMAICYQDRYAKVDGRWYFQSRAEKHWYAADQLQRPQAVGFADWHPETPQELPHAFASWAGFWSGVDTSALTDQP